MGLTLDQYWNLTLKEWRLLIENYNEQQEEKYQDLLFLAWHIEAFARQKKLDKLENVLGKQKPKEPQTVEQQIKTVEFLNKLFGGEDLRQKEELNTSK